MAVERRRIYQRWVTLDLYDYSDAPLYLWVLRRTTIWVIIGVYLTYLSFFLVVWVLVLAEGTSDGTSKMANEILSKVVELEGWPKLFRDIIVLVSGSFCGTCYQLLRGVLKSTNRVDHAISWYITLPLQNVLLAVFVYIALLAGQFILYSGVGSGLNLYSISFLAFMTGVFSENAYQSLQNLVDKVFPKSTREDL